MRKIYGPWTAPGTQVIQLHVPPRGKIAVKETRERHKTESEGTRAKQ